MKYETHALSPITIANKRIFCLSFRVTCPQHKLLGELWKKKFWKMDNYINIFKRCPLPPGDRLLPPVRLHHWGADRSRDAVPLRPHQGRPFVQEEGGDREVDRVRGAAKVSEGKHAACWRKFPKKKGFAFSHQKKKIFSFFGGHARIFSRSLLYSTRLVKIISLCQSIFLALFKKTLSNADFQSALLFHFF